MATTRQSSSLRRVAALLAVVCLGIPLAGLRTEPRFQVVVHSSNPVKQVERAALARFFLKKLTRWPDGSSVLPVDLPMSSQVREAFSEDVLSRSTSAVRAHWQQMIFSGRETPPPELGSDAAVVAYVLGNPGAIGYVSTRASLDGVRVVEVK